MKAVNLLLLTRRFALPLCLLALTAPVFAHGDEAAEQKETQIVPFGKGSDGYKDGPAPVVAVGVPKDLDARVRIDQKMDAPIPLALPFKDETGRSVTLGQFFTGKPVIINLIQLKCDQLCSAELEMMGASLRELKFSVGKEFDIVTVSIDPTETPAIAAAAKEERLKDYGRASAQNGWHFLTGSEKSIKALAQSVGYKYIWDKPHNQYIHPDGLILITADGHVSRYFLRLEYAAQDLRFGLMDASKNKIGSILDKLAQTCFHYNPVTGKYSFQIMAFLRWATGATILGGLTGIAMMLGLEKRKNKGGKVLPPVLKQA